MSDSPAPSATVALLGHPSGPVYGAIARYLRARGLSVVDQAELDAVTGQVLPGGEALMAAAKERTSAVVAVLEAGEGAHASGYLAGLADASWPGHAIVVAAVRDGVEATGPLALKLQVISGEPALLAAFDDRLRGAGLDLADGPSPALDLPPRPAPAGDELAIEVLRVAATFRKAGWFFQRDGIELVNESGEELRDVSATLLGRDTFGIKLLGSPLAVLPPGEAVPLYFEPGPPKKAELRLRVIAATSSGALAACDLPVPR